MGTIIPDGLDALRWEIEIAEIVRLIERTARWVDPETFRCGEIADLERNVDGDTLINFPESPRNPAPIVSDLPDPLEVLRFAHQVPVD